MKSSEALSPKQLREILSAGPDVVAHLSGAATPQAHPLSASLSLRDLAYACGRQKIKPDATLRPQAIMGYGISSREFSSLLANGLRHATLGAYEAQASHLAFCAVTPVENYKEISIPNVDADVPLNPLWEGAEKTVFAGMIGAGAVGVKIQSYARKIVMSRAAVINNDLTDFSRTLVNAGTNAARVEAKLVADALESNPTLDDDAPVFGTDYGNVIVQELDATSLGAAMSQLRTQKTPAGDLADLAGKHLVVAPALELKARELVHTSGVGITVTALAHLPIGRWYLFASPAVHPVISVLRLAGATKPVRVETAKLPMDYDGAAVFISADLGATFLRRTGVVRGTTA